MTVLTLPESRFEVPTEQASEVASLRAWLAARWAILFSHPEDFAQEQLEMDRWVSILGRSFSARGVVPVALTRAASDPEEGWLGRLAALDNGAATILPLDALPATLADLSACTLRAHIARSGPRFAMIVDSSLRQRRTLSYRLPAELPSPLELIGWAVALRKRDHLPDNRYETPDPSPPIRAAWVSGAGWQRARPGL